MHLMPLALRTSDGQVWNVTIIDCPDFTSYDRAAEQLYSGYPEIAQRTDILLVRPSVDKSIASLADESSLLGPFVDRIPRAATHLLASTSFEIVLGENQNGKVPGFLSTVIEKADLLHRIRCAELRRYVARSSALLTTRDNFVYYTPSKRYVRNFLRVGSIQMTRQALNAIFFWLLPYLKGCGALLSETWSISSIAINAARLLERYDPTNHSRCRVDMLSSYHDGSALVDDELLDSLQRIAAGPDEILVLISAVMTGYSLVRLRESLARSLPDRSVRYVAIYRLDEAVGIDSLCDLFGEPDDPNFSSTLEAPAGAAVISIDRHTYFPLNVSEKLVNITKAVTDPNRIFFDQYMGTGGICLHRDAVDIYDQPLRHHGIYLDIVPMMEVDKFRTKITEILNSIEVLPRLIVTPPHLAGTKLAEFAASVIAKKFGSEPISVQHPDLGPVLEERLRDAITSLGPQDIIVIVDDVSVTGHRLSAYQKNLRELKFSGRIYYLVGVARPTSESVWHIRVRDLSFRLGYHRSEWHQVCPIETVVLPDWTDRTCPWCIETAHLNSLRELGTTDGHASLILERLKVLTRGQAGFGLVNDAIWSVGGSKPRLTDNSIIMGYQGATEADVIAAVSAAVQRLRTVGAAGGKLAVGYPLATVLDSADYLGETFNDVLLRLAIMRAATRPELERWTDETENWRRQRIRYLLMLPEARPILPELALQILDAKLPAPRLSTSDLNDLVEPGTATLLQQVLSSRRALTE